jgi:hypothetical protein
MSSYYYALESINGNQFVHRFATKPDRSWWVWQSLPVKGSPPLVEGERQPLSGRDRRVKQARQAAILGAEWPILLSLSQEPNP